MKQKLNRGSSVSNKALLHRISCATAIVMLLVVGLCSIWLGTTTVKADASTKGIITPGVTNVNIRTSPNTSGASNKIVKVDGGFQMDILDTVNTSDTYAWYKVGFYLDGKYTNGYVYSEFVTIISSSDDPDYSSDTDFESYLNKQGFPESYKAGLRELHAKYPEWIFIADQTGKDWDDVVEAQNKLGRSLIHKSNVSSWKSTADGAYDWETGEWNSYDSGGWVQASNELVQYALDPRNFFNSNNVFMFESLSYNDAVHNQSGVSNIIAGSFMQSSGHDLGYNGNSYNYASGLMLAGSISGVSPYHLATRIIQEQGWKGDGASISGTIGGYSGYYNYYNQGAYASGGNSATVNGMIYAAQTDVATLRPWTTRMKSIIGGAKYIGSSYINRGQNTIYYEKFDLISPYTHQYMTNILAARSESSTAAKAYSDTVKQTTGLVFRIPVYNNMPASACPIPSGDGSPNNKLSDLSVSGYSLTPSFRMFTEEYDLIVPYSTQGITVNASSADSSASVSGTGWHDLSVGDNDIHITVTAANGSDCTYTIHVVRKQNTSSGGSSEDGQSGYTTNYDVDKNNGTFAGIGVGSNTSDVISKISCTGGAYVKIYNADGSDNNGTIATGNKVVIYDRNNQVIDQFTIIIYGDINGDGNIDIYDLIYMRQDILGIKSLEGPYRQAADTNRGNDGINIYDMIYLRKHLLNIEYIRQ